MSNLFIKRNPEVFQGERLMKHASNYFEGWYFKVIGDDFGISFIPGISIDCGQPSAFIQVITTKASYYVHYSINDFKFSYDPFYVQIGDSIFSKENIVVDICDKNQNIEIKGNLRIFNSQNIQTSILNPNIMGPFSYVPKMECNHAILSMKNNVIGTIRINGTTSTIKHGIGYIEKDWGTSFPKSYIWCQGNNFKNKHASFMLSIADIPLKWINFEGLICVLIIDDKEFKFTTYNSSHILKKELSDDKINIVLKRRNYVLNVQSNRGKSLELVAPVAGRMNRGINESISSSISVTLASNNEPIFEDTSTCCGLEIVGF